MMKVALSAPILAVLLAVSGCAADSEVTITNPDEAVAALEAADVTCNDPQTIDPQPISERSGEEAKAGAGQLSDEASKLYDERAQVEGDVSAVRCGAGEGDGTSGYFVGIAPNEFFEADCALQQQVIDDQWAVASDGDKKQFEALLAREVVVGEGLISEPLDAVRGWPTEVQPAAVAEALGGEVVVNRCDLSTPE